MEDPQKALFEKFGKLIIEEVRDPYISGIKAILANNRMPHSLEHLNPVLETLNDEQKALINELNIFCVDGILHSLLFNFESQAWIRIGLVSPEGVEVSDIRKVTSGDLQGYVFIWSETYSKEPLDFTLRDNPDKDVPGK
jgi:hypothetical protein